MKRAMAAVQQWQGITWIRIAAITGTAMFVLIMCFLEAIRDRF